MNLPPDLLAAIRADPTVMLVVAAEACLSERTVRRMRDGRIARTNSVLAVARAWQRIQARSARPSMPPPVTPARRGKAA